MSDVNDGNVQDDASEFKRVCYSEVNFRYTEEDWRVDQEYHIRMRYRHNKLLYNPGVLNGLGVIKDGDLRIKVKPGVAIDHEGRELVLVQEKFKDAPIAVNSLGDADKVFSIILTYNVDKSKADEHPTAGDRQIRWLEKPEVTFILCADNAPCDQLPDGTTKGVVLCRVKVNRVIENGEEKNILGEPDFSVSQFATLRSFSVMEKEGDGIRSKAFVGTGVFGESDKANGVIGLSHANTASGVFGNNDAENSAAGNRGIGTAGVSKHGIGLYGVSEKGVGLYANGGELAAKFDGKVGVNGDLQILGSASAAGRFDIGNDCVVNGGLWVQGAPGLHVAGALGVGGGLDVSSAGSIRLGLEKRGGGQLVIACDNDDDSIYLEGLNRHGSGNATQFVISGPEVKNLPIIKLVANEIKLFGRLTHDSSREHKKDICNLSAEKAKDVIEKLMPVSFVYKKDTSDEPQFGFIAEDVPDEIATHDRDAVVMSNVTAFLTKVVQEQQKAIRELQEKLEGLSLAFGKS